MSNKKRIRNKSWRIQENEDYRSLQYLRVKIGGILWCIPINDVNDDTINRRSQYKINRAT